MQGPLTIVENQMQKTWEACNGKWVCILSFCGGFYVGA